MKKILNRIFEVLINSLRTNPFIEKFLVLQGASISTQILNRTYINSLSDVEFSVFSQWGEDGIIEWLIQRNGEMPETFIEFGVEDFRESNCRFLMMNRNWRGLVIDGSEKNIHTIRSDSISWKYDLGSICEFITCKNINSLIKSSGITGEIGILSIDIDGNDYWVWNSIECVRPHFVIVEYNAVLGDLEPITVPYRDDFIRAKVHFSNLYYGASIMAFCTLAFKKGYTLLGSNRAGNNAFFVRNDRLPIFNELIKDKKARPSRFREGRNITGHLSLIHGLDRAEILKDMPMVNTLSGEDTNLNQSNNLFSKEWLTSIEGK